MIDPPGASLKEEHSPSPSAASPHDCKSEASDRRFRALVEHATELITLVDEEGRFTYVSPSVGRAFGRDPSELVGAFAAEWAHPDDAPLARAARCAPPGESVEGTFRVRHRDGTWHWMAGTSTNLLQDPAIRAIVSTRIDVTARRAAEEQLRFQGAVLAQVNEAVFACDIERIINYWNDAAERMYGYTSAEAIGKDGTELLQTEWPNPADVEAHRDALRATGRWRGEMTHAKKSGERFLVEASICVLRDEHGKPIAGINVMQDVTARRRLEEQLRQSQKMEAIGVFAGGVAHDFNNLLSIILGWAEAPLRQGATSQADGEALREIMTAAQRGAELTRKLLAFSRKQVMRLAPLDLNAALNEAMKLLTRLVGEDVNIVTRSSGGPLIVRADAMQVEQVVFNLATNARHAMPAGGRLIFETRRALMDKAMIEKKPWAREGQFAELSVTDTGSGMDAATLARVFEPFFTTKEQGTGLGLATVYGIVEQHDGFVHAESRPGRGSTFRVFLPLHDAAVPEAPAPDLSPPPRGRSETILLVEDEAPLRYLVTTALTSLGYRVLQAADGVEAVSSYQEHAKDIHLVMMDVVMPRLGALEAYEQMRAIDPAVNVLFTTGYAPEATALGRLLEGGRVHLLEKPFSSRKLAVSVRRALDAD